MALVQYTGKNVFGVFMGAGDIMTLLPGVNEVSDDHLERASRLPLFRHRVNKNQIIILRSTLGKDGKIFIEDMLNNMPNIFDLKLLKKIIETDDREVVKQAAMDRIAKIKNPVEKKESGTDHFK